jgi:hypothetical protein
METLQRTANRGSVSTGYDVDNSCAFEDGLSESLHKSLSSQSRDCFTISFWLKRTALGAQRLVGAGASGNNEVIIQFTSSDELEFYSWEGAYAMRYKTNRLFRDTNAWYHFAFLVDTRLSTASERTQIYVNGVLETSFSVSVVPGQNSLFDWTTNIYVGKGGAAADADMSGYLSEFVYLDDTKAAHTDLGEFDSDTGIWIPIDVSGLTFGTNGAYLDFKDSSNMGNDANGGTDFTETNISAADQATDTPTNNFAIGNILTSAGGFLVPTEGATKGVLSTSGPGNNTGGASLFSTIPVSNGKWYFEAQNTNSGDVYLYLGVGDVGGIENWGIDGKTLGSATGPSVGWRGGGAQDGKVYINNSATGSADTWETEVVGVALDLDNNKVYFHKSGTYINSGDPASGTDNGGQYDLPTAVDDQWCIGVSAYNLATWLLNFGGYTTMSISSAASDANGYGTFEYAPPSGFYALCTKNLAEYG